MNEMNNYLFENNIILKEIEDITPKTRKKIEIYLGVDMKNSYYLIVKINKKSRFLMKDVKELLELISKIEKIKDINFKYKKRVLLLSGEICSKTKEFLKDWRIL
jgi:SET domain-containing protein